ncbi:hypothetical protein HOL21_00150 [Candidatus Woesearchaeota archaeon]|nr:hypothetical protein [Candidatus Woesearchaeota archaeon]MBT5396610.1 hypothetical protein [Candidatus Woesearchaeota archaeon]MBT6368004.1 hypothetical protein [Candidatus Woesearchaeota archaeon]MBT7762224.1 hypothetical protein [Candidatus Woesearchaeota archaeon]
MGTYKLFETEDPCELESLVNQFLGGRNGTSSTNRTSDGKYIASIIRFDSRNGETPIDIKYLLPKGYPGDSHSIDGNTIGALYFNKREETSSIADHFEISSREVVRHIVEYHQKFKSEEKLPDIDYSSFTPIEIGAVTEYFLQKKQTLDNIAEETKLNVAIVKICAVGNVYDGKNRQHVAEELQLELDEVTKCAISYKFTQLPSNKRVRSEIVGTEFGMGAKDAEKVAVTYLNIAGLSQRAIKGFLNIGDIKIRRHLSR